MGIFLAAMDIVVYYGALLAAIFLRSGALFGYPYFADHIIHFSVLLILFLFVFFSFRLYESSGLASLGYFLKYSLSAFFSFGVISVLYFYFLSSPYISPKIILAYFFIILGGLWYAVRCFHRMIICAPNFRGKVAFIEVGDDGALFADNVRAAHIPLEIACTYYAANGRNSQDALVQFRECILKERVKTVVMSPNIFADENDLGHITKMLPFPLEFFDMGEAYERFLHKIAPDMVDKAWFLKHVSRSGDWFDERIKRIMDCIVGICGMGFLIILYPFIFLAVKIEDGGPIFFKQSRMGRENKSFTLYKFRTMDWKKQDQNPFWTETHDVRQTVAGKILRRFHIDEIPQAINLVKGDMSFVGPRAERIELVALYEKEIPLYAMRHLVRPGITGWAQLHFPASASVKEAREKFQYDLFYVKNHSLFLDLQIIFKTVTVVLFQRGA
jgi:exopolysaccharide biosynthesis polyprenyl glycosylphosphotransferase